MSRLYIEIELFLMFEQIPQDIGILAEEIDQSPMSTERRSLGHRFLHRWRQFVGFKVVVVLGFFRDLQTADHTATRVYPETAGIALRVYHLFGEERLDFLFSGFRIKGHDQSLIGIEPVGALEQLEHFETRWAIGHFAKVHGAVAGDEILGVNKAEFDIERLDQLLDFRSDLCPVFFKVRGSRNKHGIAEGDILGNVEKTDLAV